LAGGFERPSPQKKIIYIPSGKQHNYGKSPCLMGKSTIAMAIFNSFLYVYQRVARLKTKKYLKPPGFISWRCDPNSASERSPVKQQGNGTHPFSSILEQNQRI